MALFQGLGDQNQPQNNQNQQPQNSRVKSVLRYTMMPEILPRIRAIGLHFGHFAYLLALVFGSARLIPPHHPALNAANIGRYGVRQVIAMAANNITWSMKNIDQIAIFSAIVIGLIMIVIQAGLIAVAALVGFNPAEASSAASFFSPDPSTYTAADDPVMWFLAQVFGDLSGFWGASFINNDQVFGTNTRIHEGIYAMLSLYSMAMMVVAVIIVLYYIMTVVGEAAKTGTPFGQRFNSLWAPIRLVVALGLLVPLGTGLNSAQYITLWTAKMGSGLGTQVWTAFLPSLEAEKSEKYIFSDFQNDWVTDLAINVFVMEVCRYSETKYFGYPSSGDGSLAPRVDPDVDGANSYKIKYSRGEGVWNLRQYVSCGEISLTLEDASSSTTLMSQSVAIEQAFDLSKQIIDKLVFDGSSPIAEYAENFANSEISIGGYEEMTETLEEVIVNVVSYAQDAKSSVLNQSARDEMRNGFDAIMQEQVDKRKNSWIYAGVWYLELGRIIQNSKDVEINSLPNTYNGNVISTFGQDQTWKESLSNNTNGTIRIEKETKIMLSSLRRYLEENKSKYYPDVPEACKGIGDSADQEKWYMSFACSIAALIVPKELTILASDLPEARTLNPMASLVNAGYSIFNKAFVFVGYGLLGSLGGGALGVFGGFLGFIGGILGAIGSLAILAGALGLTAGLVMAFLLPVLPFIYFFFAAVTWIMEIFEAVIAMPLWALAHLRIDGEGMPGQAASSGYYLLLSILLRPALIVIGLIAGSVIFGAAIFMLQELFQSVLLVNNSGGGSGLEMLVYTLIFAYVAYSAGITSFKLVDTIPNQILRWIGNGTPTFSEGKEDPVQGNVGVMAATAGFVSSSASSNLSQGASGAGQGLGKSISNKWGDGAANEKAQQAGVERDIRKTEAMEKMSNSGGAQGQNDQNAGPVNKPDDTGGGSGGGGGGNSRGEGGKTLRERGQEYKERNHNPKKKT